MGPSGTHAGNVLGNLSPGSSRFPIWRLHIGKRGEMTLGTRLSLTDNLEVVQGTGPKFVPQNIAEFEKTMTFNQS